MRSLVLPRMSDEAVIAELERQRDFAQLWFAYRDRQRESRLILEMPKPDIREITSPISAVLLKHLDFARGREVLFGSKRLSLHPQEGVPHGMLRVMMDSDAQSAVAWLRRLFAIDRTAIRMVALVHGLEVQQPVSLANGVRLLPFAAAPESENFRGLSLEYDWRAAWSMDVLPTIAVLDMGTFVASADLTAWKAINDRAYAAVFDAARAFTLANRGAPVVGDLWTDFVDPTLALAEFGQLSMAAHFEGSPSQVRPLKVDDETLAWAERYLRMDETLRPSVAVALDRLNLARRRPSPGDRALDGGICLEVLLGDDSP
jgi:hypothetical protein